MPTSSDSRSAPSRTSSPRLRRAVSGSAGIELSVTDLALILNGIDLATARRRKRYCRVG